MSVSDLFSEKKIVKVCAPMVRYSKLEFRKLVRKYDCDLCFTPMIMADSFIKSEKARQNEFTTDNSDKPIIVQFASTDPNQFSEAAKLVYPFSSGVDLNCGCPQKWAVKIGIGAHLLSEPETIKNIVLNVKNQVSTEYSVSVKLRLLNDAKASVDLCKKLESAGVSFITIHGRTKDQRSQPINTDHIKEIVLSLQVPVVANGDVKTLEDAILLQKLTNCQGVMSARGLLQNPALFKGYYETPIECVKEWIQIALESKLHFMTFHHHLVFMLEKKLKKCYRTKFNNLTNYSDVLNFLNNFYDFDFRFDPSDFSKSRNNLNEAKDLAKTEEGLSTSGSEDHANNRRRCYKCLGESDVKYRNYCSTCNKCICKKHIVLPCTIHRNIRN